MSHRVTGRDPIKRHRQKIVEASDIAKKVYFEEMQRGAMTCNAFHLAFCRALRSGIVETAIEVSQLPEGEALLASLAQEAEGGAA
ncbi:hypothetical protein [Agrobacterium tumefaciens]|uniref:hypothetical protein n=1 Tax=Agrobacterium tumefaciens TaxID=358 RepID=UPI0021D1B26F|nr:hypothetical protein [Agrobacterium tumefaciens]UXS01127.1 hypothetical protein FY156_06290 [Agrobacterium tumefaciens]